MARQGQMQAFRVIVFVLALIPISAGLAGVIFGLSFPGFEVSSDNPDGASHFRFLSGIFLAMGLAYWSVAFGLGDYLRRFQLLAVLTFVGGLARLLSFSFDGPPFFGHQIGLAMELAVIPGLFLWSRSLEPYTQPNSSAI